MRSAVLQSREYVYSIERNCSTAAGALVTIGAEDTFADGVSYIDRALLVNQSMRDHLVAF